VSVVRFRPGPPRITIAHLLGYFLFGLGRGKVPLSSSNEGAEFVRKMILIFMIFNVLVLIPVCISLIGDVPRVSSVYGDYSPARGILLSVYCAILLVSLALLFKPYQC